MSVAGGLLRGTGLDLGPLAMRLPPAERTLHHVLELQVSERPDGDWLVFDNRRSLTFRGARELSRRFANRLAAPTSAAPRPS